MHITNWITNNQPRFRKWATSVLLLIGLSVTSFAYWFGHDTFLIWQRGSTTRGEIVDYGLSEFTSSIGSKGTRSSSFKWMPIVEFHVDGQDFRFQDRVASNYSATSRGDNKPSTREVVTVLYLPENPSFAMIDEQLSPRIPIHPQLFVSIWIAFFGIVTLLAGIRKFRKLFSNSKL